MYSGWIFLAYTNTIISRINFLDKYEYKYIWVYQKLANMNTNTIIRTDICEYKYEYEYYHIQNKKK